MEHSPWQLLLKNGNHCFDNHQLDQAETFYLQAYDLLSTARSDDPQSSELLMDWICTCHNLTSLYEELGYLELSLEYLMIPHEYLMKISEANYLNDESKLNAFKGMSITLPAILLFTKNHSNCDGCCSQLPSLKKIMGQEACSIN